jgi:hypothetical protein
VRALCSAQGPPSFLSSLVVESLVYMGVLFCPSLPAVALRVVPSTSSSPICRGWQLEVMPACHVPFVLYPYCLVSIAGLMDMPLFAGRELNSSPNFCVIFTAHARRLVVISCSKCGSAPRPTFDNNPGLVFHKTRRFGSSFCRLCLHKAKTCKLISMAKCGRAELCGIKHRSDMKGKKTSAPFI